MFGGNQGRYIYTVDNAGDVVVEGLAFGTDKVGASISYELAVHVENLELFGSAENGTGNDLANAITGTAGANRLRGLEGADDLKGYAGNDNLDGGTGADLMDGGDGDDNYVVDNAGDVVAEEAGKGYDRVLAAVSYVLTANVEDLFA